MSDVPFDPELFRALKPREPETATISHDLFVKLNQQANWLGILETAGVNSSPVNMKAYEILAKQITDELAIDTAPVAES